MQKQPFYFDLNGKPVRHKCELGLEDWGVRAWWKFSVQRFFMDLELDSKISTA